MAKNGLWRLGAAIAITTIVIALAHPWKHTPPDSIIGEYKIPAGLSTICGVDKDGLMIHMKIAIYDAQGNFVTQNEPPQPYSCASIPGMKAGDYWLRLFRGDK